MENANFYHTITRNLCIMLYLKALYKVQETFCFQLSFLTMLYM